MTLPPGWTRIDNAPYGDGLAYTLFKSRLDAENIPFSTLRSRWRYDALLAVPDEYAGRVNEILRDAEIRASELPERGMSKLDAIYRLYAWVMVTVAGVAILVFVWNWIWGG